MAIFTSWFDIKNPEQIEWARHYIEKQYSGFLPAAISHDYQLDSESVVSKFIQDLSSYPEFEKIHNKMKRAWAAKISRKENKNNASRITFKLGVMAQRQLEKLTNEGRYNNFNETLEALIFDNFKECQAQNLEHREKIKREREAKRIKRENDFISKEQGKRFSSRYIEKKKFDNATYELEVKKEELEKANSTIKALQEELKVRNELIQGSLSKLETLAQKLDTATNRISETRRVGIVVGDIDNKK